MHPDTKAPITRAAERVQFLKDTLVKDRSKIVIPTPALAEFLVGAGDALEDYVDSFDSNSYIEVRPFSERAAIEAAIAMQEALAMQKGQQSSDKTTTMANPRQVVKVDRQIVAIAKVSAVAAIYTTDGDVIKHAESAGVPAVHVADLPLPPEDPQRKLSFRDDHEQTAQTQPPDTSEPEGSEVPGGSDGPP